MSERSRALAAGDPRGPGGGKRVDLHRRRRRPTSRSTPGRLLIALKPHKVRDSVSVVIGAPQAAPRESFEGMALYMQPVQDLTIEDRVSRTQYQFTLESANADELATWTQARGGQVCARCRRSMDVTSDLQDQGLQAYVDHRPRHRGAPRA